MNVELTGLKYADKKQIEATIATAQESDLLAYGLNYDCNPYDRRWCEEIFAVNNMVKVAVATGYDFVLIAYTKLYAGHTEADLLPELENVTFDGDVFYLKVVSRD